MMAFDVEHPPPPQQPEYYTGIPGLLQSAGGSFRVLLLKGKQQTSLHSAFCFCFSSHYVALAVLERML